MTGASERAAEENRPPNWLAAWPDLRPDGHKYDRGHLLCVSGPMLATGAARLAAMAGLRAGAGLVTLASPPDALAVNAAHLTAIMLRRMEGASGLGEILEDKRFSAIVLGPGLGAGPASRQLAAVALGSGRPVVLDADALTSFEGNRGKLFGLIADSTAPAILTPHAGEFARLGGEPGEDRIAAARDLARESRGILVLKGRHTVIAAPDGLATVNIHASPALATAGSGDVLAGICGGLLAQGMPAFEAACAAVWMHGDASLRFGAGLISEDLPAMLPSVIAGLATLKAGRSL